MFVSLTLTPFKSGGTINGSVYKLARIARPLLCRLASVVGSCRVILDVFKRFSGGTLRAKVSPDKFAKDLEEWVPERAQPAVKAATIIALTNTLNQQKEPLAAHVAALASTTQQ